MSAPAELRRPGARRFRAKLLIAMMLVVSTIAALALAVAQRNLETAFEQELRREFQAEIAALHNVQAVRQAALLERCRVLVRRSRIHAALEDGALDLLYPSAKDELRDIMATPEGSGEEHTRYGLQAEFYRFLDRDGAVIPPSREHEVGTLSPVEARQLALRAAPVRQQLGYIVRQSAARGASLTEILAMPILSSETAEPIAGIVLGFKPAEFAGARADPGIRRGVWLDGELYLDALPPAENHALAAEVTQAIAREAGAAGRFSRQVARGEQWVFYKQLNPDSEFPPAYEVCVYPLTELQARQQRLRWQVLGAGGLLLLVGGVASHVVASRLARPVERLEDDSEENRAQRQRAEAALESTSEELQRAARFSADASHQLKTPVTVLRAGLEELLARDEWGPAECHEISALIHQTYRLSSVIEDLLLLSRMDAGRLKIEFKAVDLSHLIDAALDDHGAQPEAPMVEVDAAGSGTLHVRGEQRYIALILQNLLENARKYNRPGGRIRIVATVSDGFALLRIANTGAPIPGSAQEHIFERFHRGAIGENVPGYGLGLNLARELARLHQGDLRLVRSDEEWTEFELRLKLAPAAPAARAVS